MSEVKEYKRAHKLSTQFKGTFESWRAYRFELENEVGATSPQLLAYLTSKVNPDPVVYSRELKAEKCR